MEFFNHPKPQTMSSLNRQLSNGEYLIIEFNELLSLTEYKAHVEDTDNDILVDFEGSKGVLSEGQTREELADELAAYCNSVIELNEE